MSRRALRRRGAVRRPSNAVATWIYGNTDSVNRTDYTKTPSLGADAADRAFLAVVAQRLNEGVDPDAVKLDLTAFSKLGPGLAGNSINLTFWWMPPNAFPTGDTPTLLVDNPASGGSRSMCRVDLFRIDGASGAMPFLFLPVMNAGGGTGLDLSPPVIQPDGATITASAAPGSNASYTWGGVTEAYDTATESSDCRVSGGIAIGLPAVLTATTSGSVTNLMGAAVHFR